MKWALLLSTLKVYDLKGDECLYHIITGNNIWISYYISETSVNPKNGIIPTKPNNSTQLHELKNHSYSFLGEDRCSFSCIILLTNIYGLEFITMGLDKNEKGELERIAVFLLLCAVEVLKLHFSQSMN